MIRYRLTGFLLIILAIMSDQITKQWAISDGLQSRFIEEVTSFFNLILVWNRGISFGMFSNHPEWMPIILTVVALAITAFLLHWLWKAETKLAAIALGLVIGGALGNVIDRLRFGAVVDFLDFHLHGYHWPAFNLADSFIFIGVVLLLIETIMQERKAKLKDET